MRAFFPLILLLFSFKPLPEKYRGITKEELAFQIDQVRLMQSGVKRAPKTAQKSSKNYLKLQKELKKLKKVRGFNPSFGDEYGTIATFERFRGVLDGNIISSGHPVNFKVNFKDASKIPSGSYLSCTGTNLAAKYNFRIIASCDRLITPTGEFDVNIGLKDQLKVDGLKPDHVYTGDEEAIIGEGFSAIMGGIIDARKERIQTAVGFSEAPNLKNAYLNGLVRAAKMANEKAKDHTSKQAVVLAVRDQTEVIIEFKRRFSYEKTY